MPYFLAKTDPDTYSIDDMERDQTTNWDGVHSHQAVNFIKTWQPGDLVFIYHSQGENSIVGLVEVTSLPEPDLTDERKICWYTKVRFVRRYDKTNQITLKQIKESGLFNDWFLVRQGRLSTMSVPDSFVEWAKLQGLKVEKD
jgi:predicted RNA-binding protein with PUA-like domain